MDRIQILANGMTFDAWASGPPGGEAVLLLHGFPETSAMWRHQMGPLAEAGYRAVAPDQRGYSPGARPTDVAAYRSDHLVGDVIAIADAVGAARFHLVGHDWGGAMAWQVAGRHAERVRTLTVLSTPHPRAFGQGLAGDLGGDQPARSGYMEVFRSEGAEHGFLAEDAQGLRFIYAASGMTDEQAEPYLEALGTPEALGAALNWYRAADLTLVEGLGPITTPTLYVWSTDDPALGREIAEATAGCVDGPFRFEVLEGVSHWIAEHAPERTTELLLEHLRSG